MKLSRLLLAVVFIVVSGLATGRAAEPIFDGRSLDGWDGNLQYWSIEDEAITGTIPDGEPLRRNEFLFWKDEVHDFELTLEFRITGTASANSGIQFRSERLENGGAAGYQADLDLGETWLGRIYDEHGRALLVERGTRVSIAPDGRRSSDVFSPADDFRNLAAPGEWHTYRVNATGPHVEIWINDRLWSALDDHETNAADYTGRLAVQLHSGPGPVKIQFRNIRLTHLGKTEKPKRAVAPPDEENRQTQSPVLWHLRSNMAEATPISNSAAQTVVSGMMLTDGFQAELIAAEPDVHQPIAFAIDERGRLWIAEAFSYPNKQPEGEGKDCILILEDQDNDGQFETRRTFMEGLNLVSGIEIGFGGVWIGAAPELLFIPDRNHDDLPDGPPQVLLDGFGYQDTHETLNSLIWGPDGWLYGNQGVFNTASIGKPGAPDSERTLLRAGVWRYHPLRHEFAVFAHGGSNHWGLDFNEVGDLFMTHCRSYWGGGGTTYVIRNGHFWNQTNSDYAAFISNSAPKSSRDLRNFLPASARYDSGEGGAGKPGTRAIYGGHSHVGTMIYLGDNWPAIYRNRLFTHNLHGHQVNQQVNVREGSAYETIHAGYDLMYVPDPAYVAVDLQYGPDGAVYVIDWVDLQHCHNPRAEQWDRTNGRVYRISWAETFRPVTVNLAAMTDCELVEQQSHRNQWYARTARRLLQERAASSVDPDAIKLLHDQVKDADETVALPALWSLHVTGELGPSDLEVALNHGTDNVRAWAIRLATETKHESEMSGDVLARLANDDPSPVVRLALASALPYLTSEDCWRIGSSLAAHAEDADDRFLAKMYWYGLASVVSDDVPRALAIADSTPLRSIADGIYWYVARQPEGRDAIVRRMVDMPSDERAEYLLGLLQFSLRYEANLDMPAEWGRARDRFAGSRNTAVRQMTEELSAVFGDQEVLALTRSLLADETASNKDRRRALAALKRVGDVDAMDVYLKLLDHTELRGDVIGLLGSSSDDRISNRLLDVFDVLSDLEKRDALSVLTSRPEFALVLLRAINGGTFDRQNLTALQIRQMHNLGHDKVGELLKKVWGEVGSSSADAEKAIARIRDTYSTAPLWAFSERRGQQTYEKTCATCHPLDGRAVPLGPGLAASWRNGVDYFLENIVDPNAVVGENYRMTLITTDSGLVASGLLDSETETAVVLRTADNKTVSIPKQEIDDRRIANQSIMPTGLLDDLSEIELIELLKFLTQRR